MGKLAVEFGLLEPLRDLAAGGLPMWGTCAASSCWRATRARSAAHRRLDVTVQRNAFGRQLQSFETDLAVPFWPIPAPFGRCSFEPAHHRIGPG